MRDEEGRQAQATPPPAAEGPSATALAARHPHATLGALVDVWRDDGPQAAERYLDDLLPPGTCRAVHLGDGRARRAALALAELGVAVTTHAGRLRPRSAVVRALLGALVEAHAVGEAERAGELLGDLLAWATRAAP